MSAAISARRTQTTCLDDGAEGEERRVVGKRERAERERMTDRRDEWGG